jgi:hypothetical protein
MLCAARFVVMHKIKLVFVDISQFRVAVITPHSHVGMACSAHGFHGADVFFLEQSRVGMTGIMQSHVEATAVKMTNY